MDLARNHVTANPTCFLNEDHVDQIAGMKIHERVHVADFRDHTTLREGMKRFTLN